MAISRMRWARRSPPLATTRGAAYLEQYPGWFGYLLFFACTGAVFLAGAKILDCLRYERAAEAEPAAK